MSTKLYVANDTSVVYSPATTKGAWDQTAGFVTHRLTPNRTGQRSSIGIAETSATNNFDVLLYRGVTDPLLADTTISGTLDFTYNCAESSVNANDVLHIHAWVTVGDSDTVRGTLLADFVDTTEWASGGASAVSGLVMPQQSITTVNALAGDRIVIEIGYQAQNTVTTSFTGTLKIGGNINDATGSEVSVSATNQNTGIPFFTFSTTLVFAPTYFYLTNSAAGSTPAAVRGTWTDTTAMVTKALSPTKSGAATSTTQSETSTSQFDGLIYRGVSDLLAEQTITATDVTIISALVETNASADVVLYAHAYVMASDGTVRGTLLTNNEFSPEVSVSAAVQQQSFTPSSVNAKAGDRIVFELGARFKNVSASSFTARIFYGGTTGDAGPTTATGESDNATAWIRFAQALAWFVRYPSAQVVMAG